MFLALYSVGFVYMVVKTYEFNIVGNIYNSITQYLIWEIFEVVSIIISSLSAPVIQNDIVLLQEIFELSSSEVWCWTSCHIWRKNMCVLSVFSSPTPMRMYISYKLYFAKMFDQKKITGHPLLHNKIRPRFAILLC